MLQPLIRVEPDQAIVVSKLMYKTRPSWKLAQDYTIGTIPTQPQNIQTSTSKVVGIYTEMTLQTTLMVAFMSLR